jgi:hypothetical protein
MLIDDRAMRCLALVVVFGLFGCTRPNPRDCADGVCSDPAYPFCDVDGALEGQSKTCIGVSCTAGEFRACRGDVSVVCNATGNDYDLIACERGCDATHGCRACTTEADCANPTPVCDMEANACRACKLDDECASAVCEDGKCSSEAGILYVLPNGSDSSTCSRTQPCSLLQGTILARAAAVPPIIRLLPGVYPAGLYLATPTALPLRYVASGATMAAAFAIRIEDGAKAEIRGVTAAGSSVAIQCTSTTNAMSVLTLKDSVMRVGDGGASLVYIEKCALSMFGSELDIGSSTGASVTVRGDSQFTADRIHAHGVAVSMIGAGLANNISVKITNSLFENVDMGWRNTYDASSPGSVIMLAFNTIVLEARALSCEANSGSAYRKTYVENNIIVAPNALSAITGTDCLLAHNVITPFSGAPGSNIVADPQFVDAASWNYHLLPTSPAIDAAVPSGSPPTPDYDGVARPQGPQPDIGAFERTP